ncbi:MAG: adenylosuccinate synthetase [Parcubacteria group bacterium Gr01-1014_13]|nr:MAG: adenylosuccinate synthetase [Parcubacteria group bacterium Gr01-1014_13]
MLRCVLKGKIMPMDVLVGLQWGDEGKGKIVDYLSQDADIVARWGGGANAGHTVYLDGKKHVMHLLPSGLLQGKMCVLGAGMVIDPEQLLKEIDGFAAQGIDVSPGRIMISSLAHIVLPTHRALDGAHEGGRGKVPIGTTKRGIGPTYADRARRRGLRAVMMKDPVKFGQQVRQLMSEHLDELRRFGIEPNLNFHAGWHKHEEYANRLAPYIKDTSVYLSNCLLAGANILAEGAQGTLLDVDYGTYPYVTSSSTIASSAALGLGLDSRCIRKVIGVAKCFQTRVGEGPMPTELPFDSVVAKHLRSEGKPGEEKGATTGRPRRVGWLDLPLLRYAARINGLDELVLTKLDVLSGLEFVRTCESYKYNGEEIFDLQGEVITNLKDCVPQYQDSLGWPAYDIVCGKELKEVRGNAGSYIQRVERAIGMPVSLVSVGVDRNDVIKSKGNWFLF